MDGQPSNEIKSAKLRLFIALQVPEVVKTEIQLAQDEFRRELPLSCARWTRPEQWHLTLKFLGNVEAGRLDALTTAVRGACQNLTPLKLCAEQIGCFPDLRHPRVIWVGVRDAANQLAALAEAVECATAEFTSEAREGKFTGHITIARLNQIKRPEVERVAKLAQHLARRGFGSWTAEAVEIIRSELSPGGAKHTCLARPPLNRPDSFGQSNE